MGWRMHVSNLEKEGLGQILFKYHQFDQQIHNSAESSSHDPQGSSVSKLPTAQLCQ
jgi:hypothetical protein